MMNIQTLTAYLQNLLFSHHKPQKDALSCKTFLIGCGKSGRAIPVSASDAFSVKLTKHLSLMHDGKAGNHVLVFGCGGRGKSYSFIQPNIMMGNCNMIITDTFHEYYDTCAENLRNKGYDVYHIADAYSKEAQDFLTNILPDFHRKEKQVLFLNLNGRFSYDTIQNKGLSEFLTEILEYRFQMEDMGRQIPHLQVFLDNLHHIYLEKLPRYMSIGRRSRVGFIINSYHLPELKEKYPSEISTIFANCSAVLVLGVMESQTLKWIEKNAVSHTESLSAEEVKKLPMKKAIVICPYMSREWGKTWMIDEKIR